MDGPLRIVVSYLDQSLHLCDREFVFDDGIVDVSYQIIGEMKATF